jgi:hypothetical protein
LLGRVSDAGYWCGLPLRPVGILTGWPINSHAQQEIWHFPSLAAFQLSLQKLKFD